MNSYSYKNNIGWLIVLIICLLLLGGCIVLNVLLLIKVKFKTKNMTDIKNNFEVFFRFLLTLSRQRAMLISVFSMRFPQYERKGDLSDRTRRFSHRTLFLQCF